MLGNFSKRNWYGRVSTAGRRNNKQSQLSISFLLSNARDILSRSLLCIDYPCLNFHAKHSVLLVDRREISAKLFAFFEFNSFLIFFALSYKVSQHFQIAKYSFFKASFL